MAILIISCLFQDGSRRFEFVQRLEQKIFEKYDKNIIPKSTAEQGVHLTFDLALNQIIDVVSRAMVSQRPGQSRKREVKCINCKATCNMVVAPRATLRAFLP